MQPIREMTDRELDAAVATEVMGWSDYRQGKDFDYMSDRPCRLWCPTWRHEDNEVVESEIERRGLVGRYLLELAGILDLSKTTNTYEQHWRIRRATPRQICEAALAAVRGAKG